MQRPQAHGSSKSSQANRSNTRPSGMLLVANQTHGDATLQENLNNSTIAATADGCGSSWAPGRPGVLDGGGSGVGNLASSQAQGHPLTSGSGCGSRYICEWGGGGRRSHAAAGGGPTWYACVFIEYQLFLLIHSI